LALSHDGSGPSYPRRAGVVMVATRAELRALAPRALHPADWPVASEALCSAHDDLLVGVGRAHVLSRVPLGLEDRPAQHAGLPLFRALAVAVLLTAVTACVTVDVAAPACPSRLAVSPVSGACGSDAWYGLARFTVDRIVGGFVVLEDSTGDLGLYDVPARLLPGVREGDYLMLDRAWVLVVSQ
jgi:hypothetical protein